MVSLLVIDHALHDPTVLEMLFAQADMDHNDKSTEYGGTLESEADGFVVTLFPPRPNSRLGDFQFIASQDMIDQSTFALAHYHFHVQKWRNVRYAGPSQGDRVYATQHGRTCMVLTGVEQNVLGSTW